MKGNKFLVSSEVFEKFLNNVLKEDSNDFDNYEFSVTALSLIYGYLLIGVEANGSMKFSLSVNQIEVVRDILHQFSDRPILIQIDTDSQFFIKEIPI